MACMRITKFGHACVRLEHGGQALVVDPGSFTEREALDGATAVLVTHEHDIADFASRVISFRDGHVVSDKRITPVDALHKLRELVAELEPAPVS